MKKIVIIFSLCFGITQAMVVAEAHSEQVPIQKYDMIIQSGFDEKFHSVGTCKMAQLNGSDMDDEENLYIGACKSNSYAYISDNDGSERFCDKHIVCILGTSCVPENGTRTNFCWYADTGGDDEWKVKTSIQDCKGGKWTKKGKSKIPVFVNNEDKVIQSKTGYFPVSLVYTAYPEPFNVKCVAYICPDGSYGCNDGTCSENCNDNNNTPPPVVHRNTVGPYLNALKTKCGI